jgi:predicted DNA-binding ribbon-helix-helix protein
MLEPEFWSVLDACAIARKISLPALIAEIDQARLRQPPPPGLASALRTFALGEAARSGVGDEAD